MRSDWRGLEKRGVLGSEEEGTGLERTKEEEKKSS